MVTATNKARAAKERDAAQKARRLSDEHRRAHRHTDPADAAVAKRGNDLERTAREASAKLATTETVMHAEAVVRRRKERIADEAGLQSRLRAEAQARGVKRRQRQG